MTELGGRVRKVALGLALVAVLVACGSPGGVQANATLPEAGSVTSGATAPTTGAAPATTAPVATPLPAPTALAVPAPPATPTTPPPTTVASPPGSATATGNAAPEGTARPTGAPAASAPPAPASTARPAQAPPGPTPAPATSSDSRAVLIANGSEVYTLNCANCHGENGLGSFQYSGIWGVGSRYSAAGLTAELTTGHPFTFGFADKLSADEIASVVAYVLATF